ncbi:MAG: hypothetical protein LBU80_02240 [Rikenellaceae bacterium]|jgi:DUF971 family protein|nr:hypothetical protein [Rikenellaceae bacterium]
MKRIVVLSASLLLIACDDLMIKDISEQVVRMTAPASRAETHSPQIAFLWEELSGADDYRLTVAAPSFSKIERLWKDTMMTETQLGINLPDGDYEWRVQAYNSGYQSRFETLSFRVQTATDISRETISVISPVANLETNDPQVAFAWDPLPGAAAYRVRVASPSFRDIRWLAADTTLTETILRLDLADGVYEWQIHAFNVGCRTNTQTSAFAIRTIEDISAKAIRILAPTPDIVMSGGRVAFAWDPLSGADSYRLTLVSPAFDKVQWFVADTVVTDHLVRFDLPDGKYQWRIQALNSRYRSAVQNYAFEVLISESEEGEDE